MSAPRSFFEICIHRPVMTAMMSLGLVMFGLLGARQLPIRELPDVDPTIITVMTTYRGASAEVIESEVTEPLEEQIASAESIKVISSASREQLSTITVEFSQGRDIELAAQDVRDRVARARSRLPDGVDEPLVSKQDANAFPIMWLAFTSDRYSATELTRLVEDRVKDRLQTVPGVSSLMIGGAKRYAIRLRLDPERMAAHAITVADVERALREQNVELPSGRVESFDREMAVQVEGQVHTPAEFEKLILRQDGTTVVRLGDVGRAEDGVEDERQAVRYKGVRGVGVGVVRQSRANAIEVAHGIRKVMENSQALLPPGVNWALAFDSSLHVERAVYEVFETIGIAFALVVLTIFVFLRDIRATILPALAVPVSVIATFGVLYFLGFSINIFTLLALVLAIGIVVDDSIVVLENIHRHLEDGKTAMQAAVLTMNEIAFAIVTITLSLVAVFFPLAFLTGITGKLLVEFAMSLVTAVMVSAFVALTLAPTVGARVLKPEHAIKHGRLYEALGRGFDALYRIYGRALGWALSHRRFMVALAAGSLALSWYCFSHLNRDFFPEEDQGTLTTLVITPQGSTPDYMDRNMRKVEAINRDIPDFEGYFAVITPSLAGPGDATQAFSFIQLKDGERRSAHDIVQGPNGLGARLSREVEGALAFPIMPKSVQTSWGQPFRLVISNPDLHLLAQEAGKLTTRFREAGFLAFPRSTFEISKPEVRVSIDRDRAGALGVPILEISRTLQVLFGDIDVSRIKIAGKEYKVIAQLARTERLTPSDLERLFVRNDRGELVQLANVVRIDTGAGPNVIERYQRSRSATIEGTPAGIPLGTAMQKAEEILASELPPDFTYEWAGDARNLREASSDIGFLFVLAIIAVYMVLAAQFESLVHPFTVLLALPLAFLGAFGSLYALSWVDWAGNMLYGWVNYAPSHPAWAEWLSHLVPRIPAMNLNVFSQVGLVILVGLVTKNSILLVEFANQRRAEGMDARSAMIEAGRVRLRPILMTSLATIAGIMPIALGFGEASEARRPLGVVAVGGLLTSTVLTLFVIPVFYTLLADLTDRRRKTVTAPESQ
ncbi:MAG: efflux RND transporter permease subunit [Gammaproteobacteria bacterium]